MSIPSQSLALGLALVAAPRLTTRHLVVTSTAKIGHPKWIMLFSVMELGIDMFVHSDCDTAANATETSRVADLSFNVRWNYSTEAMLIGFH